MRYLGYLRSTKFTYGGLDCRYDRQLYRSFDRRLPRRGGKVLIEHQFSFDRNEMIAVELETEAQLKSVTRALVMAEMTFTTFTRSSFVQMGATP